MKSKITLLTLVLLAIVVSAFSVPMNGTYTIGGSLPSFATFKAAMDTLYARGVNGPVIFDIRPGTYNGQINIANIQGTSATNNITIKSENNDSTSVILTDTASFASGNFVFHVFGTDHLTLKNVTLHRIGLVTNCTVINVATNSKYFKLIGCIVMNDFSAGTAQEQSLIYWNSGSSADSLITFDRNILINGSYGIFMSGQNINSHFWKPQFTNNIFQNQSYRAINLNYATNAIFSNNVISSTYSFYTSIYLQHGIGETVISGNKFSGISDGDVILLDSVVGTTGAPARIFNNFISMDGVNYTTAIRYFNARRINTDYNSIYINNSNVNTAAIRIESGDSSLNFRNNIFYSSGGAITFNVSQNNTDALTISDNNDLFVDGAFTNLAYWDTGYAVTLADWQTVTGQDANSISADPLFISSTDLHAGSPAVNNAGVFLASITTDIDGQTRSNVTPDIGADEFLPLNDNLGVIQFLLPSRSTCGDSTATVAVIIKNYGLDPQTGFDVHADLTGVVTTLLTETYSGSIASNTTDTVYFSTTVNTYVGGTLNIAAYTSLPGDQYNDNDTILGSFEFLTHPATPAIASPQTVCDNNVMITGIPADTTEVLVWFDQPSGGNMLFVGNTFSPALISDSVFFAESHLGNPQSGCLRVTEIQPEDNPYDIIEITNVSGSTVNATGWKVLVSDNYNDINLYNPFIWDLTPMGAGSIRFRTDNLADTNTWGQNLTWGNGFPGWALIIDDQNNVIDFVAWEWDSLSIANMVVYYNGDSILPGSVWMGPGVSTCINNLSSMQRSGTNDNDVASDWACNPITTDTLNAGLSSVFAFCGLGQCASVRVPVNVLLTAGITPVYLGNDTVISNIDSLLLDAGAGYTTYLWSTGDTTQTIWAMQGTYSVTVTGGVSGCSYSDAIVINSPVALYTTFSNDEISIYPNPAHNKLTVSAAESVMKNSTFRITDIQGRIHKVISSNGQSHVNINLDDLSEGLYYLQITSGNKSGVKKFTVIK